MRRDRREWYYCLYCIAVTHFRLCAWQIERGLSVAGSPEDLGDLASSSALLGTAVVSFPSACGRVVGCGLFPPTDAAGRFRSPDADLLSTAVSAEL